MDNKEEGRRRKVDNKCHKTLQGHSTIAHLTRQGFRPCPDVLAFIAMPTGGSVLPDELQLEATDSFRSRVGGTLATPTPRSTPRAMGSEGVVVDGCEGWEEPLEALHPPEGACPSLVSLSCFN